MCDRIRITKTEHIYRRGGKERKEREGKVRETKEREKEEEGKVGFWTLNLKMITKRRETLQGTSSKSPME